MKIDTAFNKNILFIRLKDLTTKQNQIEFQFQIARTFKQTYRHLSQKLPILNMMAQDNRI